MRMLRCVYLFPIFLRYVKFIFICTLRVLRSNGVLIYREHFQSKIFK